jgi:hypothetical protein
MSQCKKVWFTGAVLACVLAAAQASVVRSAFRSPDPVLTPPHDVVVTSSAFPGDLPAREGSGSRPIAELPGEAMEGEVVHIGRGCIGDPYLGNPAGKIALIERGECFFREKFERALAAGAIGVIVYDNTSDILSGMLIAGPSLGPPLDIPGVFVWRSTGLALVGGAAPVHARVEATGTEHLLEYLEDAVHVLSGAGLLSHGQLTSLLQKLALAQRQIDRGKIDAAITMLMTFIHHVETLVDHGGIAAEDGALLIQAAEAMIESL